MARAHDPDPAARASTLLGDFDSLVPGHGLSRRAFVRGSVGSGFAAAVLPVVG